MLTFHILNLKEHISKQGWGQFSGIKGKGLTTEALSEV